MLFDTHAHLDDRAFHEDREQLLKTLPEKGMGIKQHNLPPVLPAGSDLVW